MGNAEYTPVELHGNGVVGPSDTTNPVTTNQECTVGAPHTVQVNPVNEWNSGAADTKTK